MTDRPCPHSTRTDRGQQLAVNAMLLAKITARVEAAWDDGNALGLDGWTGPERGEEPDDHAIQRREKLSDKLADEIAGLLAAHDAQVTAKALRDAADEIEPPSETTRPYLRGYVEGVADGKRESAARVRDRADRLEDR